MFVSSSFYGLDEVRGWPRPENREPRGLHCFWRGCDVCASYAVNERTKGTIMIILVRRSINPWPSNIQHASASLFVVKAASRPPLPYSYYLDI